jgi:hypothetical protein
VSECDGDRREWGGALEATRPAWRSAYLGEPDVPAEAIAEAYDCASELAEARHRRLENEHLRRYA